MSKLKTLGAGLVIVSQLSCGNTQTDVKDDYVGLGGRQNIENIQGTEQVKTSETTINAIYDTLEKEKSIAYTLTPGSKVYKDSDGKEVLLSSPEGIVIRNNSINQNESTQDFLCIEYRGHKAWIDRSALIKNKGKSMEEIDRPTTEKVIKVYKSARKMEIYDQYGKHKVKEFKIGICKGDVGDKKVKGDGNTPEGKYYICFKNPASSFGTNPKTGGRLGSLQVSYPNLQDAFEGLISGDISQTQFNSINASIKSKGIPSQGTRLGNYIMIHGGGNGDWTIGCMALDDGDMLRLYNFIIEGTDLYIY